MYKRLYILSVVGAVNTADLEWDVHSSSRSILIPFFNKMYNLIMRNYPLYIAMGHLGRSRMY